jgi:site-specific DNA-methyltransferase (adenine-specific)
MRSLLNEMAAVEVEAGNSAQMGNSASSVEDIVLSNGSDSKKEGTTLKIDPDFQKLLPILPQETIDGLRKSIQTDGCTDPIIVWKGQGIVIDGHNRLQICTELGIPYAVQEMEFESKEDAAKWIIERQINRRNLNTFQRIEASLMLYGEYFQDLAKKNRHEGASRGGKPKGKSYQDLDKTSKPVHVNVEIAKIAKTNPDYVSRVRSFLKDPDKNKQIIEKLRNEEMSLDSARYARDQGKRFEKRMAFNAQNLPFENGKEVLDTIICADVLDGLRKLPTGKVTLVLTSPPYCVDMNYGNDYKGEKIIDNRPWPEYCRWLKEVFIECKRILRPGGRCVINIDSIRTRDKEDRDRCYKRNIAKDIGNIMDEVGLNYFDEIAWVKPNINEKKNAWGSWCSPSHPAIRRNHEQLFIFSKDQWELPTETGETGVKTITEEDFLKLTWSFWNIHAETNPPFPHPAPFPVDLAEAVLKLLSYKSDWVVDCFSGTATTCVAAVRLNRHYTGIDISNNYCAEGKKRIEEELTKLNSMKKVA